MRDDAFYIQVTAIDQPRVDVQSLLISLGNNEIFFYET